MARNTSRALKFELCFIYSPSNSCFFFLRCIINLIFTSWWIANRVFVVSVVLCLLYGGFPYFNFDYKIYVIALLFLTVFDKLVKIAPGQYANRENGKTYAINVAVAASSSSSPVSPMRNCYNASSVPAK